VTTNLKVGALVLAATTLAAGGGYWYGQRQSAAHEATQAVSTVGSASDKKERKVLYYRNPMGLPDTSPTPKKDPMGMDYIPVYEGEEPESTSGAPQVRISAEKVQKMGVRTEAAALPSVRDASCARSPTCP